MFLQPADASDRRCWVWGLCSLWVGGVALSVLCACGDTTGDGATSEATSSAETAIDAIDERFFGVFHHEDAAVGSVFEPPPGAVGLYFWQIVDLRRDGSVIFEDRVCDAVEFKPLRWARVAHAQEIELLPNEGEHIVIRDVAYSQVRFGLGPCGELVGTYAPSSGKPVKVRRFPPGRVCVEAEGQCTVEVVWCDDRPHEACPSA